MTEKFYQKEKNKEANKKRAKFLRVRGCLVEPLRRGIETVEESASKLQLTDNAFYAHLAVLERDELVTQSGFRTGARKPSFTNKLTREAEFFPKLIRLYFVAIDRTSKSAYAVLHANQTRDTACRFLHQLIAIVPYHIHTILTDNGI